MQREKGRILMEMYSQDHLFFSKCQQRKRFNVQPWMRRANFSLTHTTVKLETVQPNQSGEHLIVGIPRPKFLMETYMHILAPSEIKQCIMLCCRQVQCYVTACALDSTCSEIKPPADAEDLFAFAIVFIYLLKEFFHVVSRQGS